MVLHNNMAGTVLPLHNNHWWQWKSSIKTMLDTEIRPPSWASFVLKVKSGKETNLGENNLFLKAFGIRRNNFFFTILASNSNDSWDPLGDSLNTAISSTTFCWFPWNILYLFGTHLDRFQLNILNAFCTKILNQMVKSDSFLYLLIVLWVSNVKWMKGYEI